MATKLGFSTGKGFLEKVDKATQATSAAEAHSATHTDFTHSEWTEYAGDDNIYVREGRTYECICCQVLDTSYSGSTLESYADQFIFTVPPAELFIEDGKVYLRKHDSRVYYLSDPEFYENYEEHARYDRWRLNVPAADSSYMTVKVFLREIR